MFIGERRKANMAIGATELATEIALGDPLFRTALRAIALTVGHTYVPTLKELEELNKQHTVAEKAGPVCQRVYEWSLAMKADSMPLLRQKSQLFEGRSVDGHLATICAEVCGPMKAGQSTREYVDLDLKAMVEVGFGAIADTFNHHALRYMKVAHRPEDAAEFARVGGVLTNMSGKRKRKCENALITNVGVESLHGAHARDAARRARRARRGELTGAARSRAPARDRNEGGAQEVRAARDGGQPRRDDQGEPEPRHVAGARDD